MACDRIGRRTAICEATPEAAGGPEELAALKKSPYGGVRAAKRRRNALSAGADLAPDGGEGPSPPVGTWDHKDLVYCFSALNVVTGQFTTRLLEQPARTKRRPARANSSAYRWPLRRTCATALSASMYAAVIITIDTAPGIVGRWSSTY